MALDGPKLKTDLPQPCPQVYHSIRPKLSPKVGIIQQLTRVPFCPWLARGVEAAQVLASSPDWEGRLCPSPSDLEEEEHACTPIPLQLQRDRASRGHMQEKPYGVEDLLYPVWAL